MDQRLLQVTAATAASFFLALSAASHVACTTATTSQSLVAPASAAEAVALARRSLGWDELAASGRVVRVTGSARILGTDATETMLFDAGGRYVQSFDGPMTQSSGSDGSTEWSRDWSGTPRVLVLGERAQAELERLFATGAWTLDDERLRFEDVVRVEGDDLVLDFAHQDGIMRGTIRLDAKTHRPRAISYASDTTPTDWTFADYADHDGFAFPGRIEFATQGHPQTFATERVEKLARVDESVFVPRLERPRDARFDASVAPALEVKLARTGHVLVHPLVNGQDLGWFIFDTGAGTNCISEAVTAKLETESFGEVAAVGVGGTVGAHFWRAREMRLGPITIDAPIFMGLDLAFLEPHFGVKVGGILGYEFLARCVAEIDMQAGAISIHDPDGYVLAPGGRWEELILYGRHPCVRATFEDHHGVFRIDTGAAGDTVTFHYQVVADLKLADGRETRAGNAGGVGGAVVTKIGTLTKFRLGGRDFEAVEASFALEDKGAFADDYTAGNIGGKLLEPFRMVFDYPGGRVGFVPR